MERIGEKGGRWDANGWMGGSVRVWGSDVLGITARKGNKDRGESLRERWGRRQGVMEKEGKSQ